MEPAARDERSLPALFTELNRGTSELVRQEIALARAEFNEKIDQVRSGLVSLAIGGVVALVGLFFLVQAAVFGVAALLALWIPGEIAVWLAPLLVGIVAVLIGLALLYRGLRTLGSTSPVPRRTAASLRRDKGMVEEHV